VGVMLLMKLYWMILKIKNKYLLLCKKKKNEVYLYFVLIFYTCY
jgi:hypothetical protein